MKTSTKPLAKNPHLIQWVKKYMYAVPPPSTWASASLICGIRNRASLVMSMSSDVGDSVGNADW